jgi:hypothetical protein
MRSGQNVSEERFIYSSPPRDMTIRDPIIQGVMTKPMRAKRKLGIRMSIIEILQSKEFEVGYH